MNTSVQIDGLSVPAEYVRRYVDGKPAQPKPPRIVHNDNVKHGERQREKILAIVDEWGEVDLTFLVADDSLGICRRGIQVHLTRLVDEKKLVRVEPEKAGAGRCVVWKRPSPVKEKP